MVTLAEIHTSRGYEDWHGHLLYPGKTSSEGSDTLSHPQNLQPQIFPANKICRDTEGADTKGRANQWLLQIETHSTWANQRLTLLLIHWYACRQEPSIIVSCVASSTGGWKQMQRAANIRRCLSESPQADLQSQLTWDHEGHRDWTSNQRTYRGWT